VYAYDDIRPGLADLVAQQDGVCSVTQLLAHQVHRRHVEQQLRQRRWSRWGPRVVLLQNAPPTRRQLLWAAVLHSGPYSALTGLTALEASGLQTITSDLLHAVVPRGVTVPRMPGLKVHELRRYSLADRCARTLPAVGNARATVDAAVLQPLARFALTIVSTVVQQRLSLVDHIAAELDNAGAVRHRRLLLAHLGDLTGQTHAQFEVDMLRLCKRANLAPPRQQVVRTDAYGRKRYHDFEWLLPDGTILVLEVDGAQHMEVRHWADDIARDRANVVAGRKVLRCTNDELRRHPERIIADLIAAGVPRLVSRHAG